MGHESTYLMTLKPTEGVRQNSLFKKITKKWLNVNSHE